MKILKYEINQYELDNSLYNRKQKFWDPQVSSNIEKQEV